MARGLAVRRPGSRLAGALAGQPLQTGGPAPAPGTPTASGTMTGAGGRVIQPREVEIRRQLAELFANPPSSRPGNAQAQFEHASKIGPLNAELARFTGGAGAEIQRARAAGASFSGGQAGAIQQLQERAERESGTAIDLQTAERERAGNILGRAEEGFVDPIPRRGTATGAAGGVGGVGTVGGGGEGLLAAQPPGQSRLDLERELGRGELDLSRERFGFKRDLINRLFPGEDTGVTGGAGGGELDVLEEQLRARALQETTPESIGADPRTGVARLSGQRQSERSRARLAAQGAGAGFNPLESGDFQAELNKLDLARAQDEAAFESGLVGEQEAERTRARSEALELREAKKSRRLARELAQQQQRSSLIANL